MRACQIFSLSACKNPSCARASALSCGPARCRNSLRARALSYARASVLSCGSARAPSCVRARDPSCARAAALRCGPARILSCVRARAVSCACVSPECESPQLFACVSPELRACQSFNCVRAIASSCDRASALNCGPTQVFSSALRKPQPGAAGLAELRSVCVREPPAIRMLQP